MCVTYMHACTIRLRDLTSKALHARWRLVGKRRRVSHDLLDLVVLVTL